MRAAAAAGMARAALAGIDCATMSAAGAGAASGIPTAVSDRPFAVAMNDWIEATDPNDASFLAAKFLPMSATATRAPMPPRVKTRVCWRDEYRDKSVRMAGAVEVHVERVSCKTSAESEPAHVAIVAYS